MAELVFGRIGAAIGGQILGPLLGSFGAKFGRTLGRKIGRGVDARLSGARRIVGPRMQDVQLQGASDGDPIAHVIGRVRLAGQVIWAANFKEHRDKVRAGKGGGPQTEQRRYSLSFAVGLCEGPITRIERAWANGRPLDLSGVPWRLHTGAESQAPDPLIEAIEGAAATPAYRGLAYIVFEDFPLDGYGATVPQMSFEVVRAPLPDAENRLETMARGVCLIPGSGEFALATQPVRRVVSPGAEAMENAHAQTDASDLSVALDQLRADLPQCNFVMLVVAWFGDDLRCAHCRIRPGVDRAVKTTKPMTWRVQGLGRDQAMLVSHVDGAAAFGGTPCDDSVVQAIKTLRARGFRVGLYPFVLMDIPQSNTLPDPYGGASQSAYPWRGRLTPSPAAGQSGAVDKTAACAAQVAAFFGSAAPAHFTATPAGVTYAGPSEWSFRRFILHYAHLAEAAGGVDAFVIGSELRALTTARGEANSFPAVTALKALAGDVRSVLGPEPLLTYAADWSEYFGYQPTDGSGDVFFHLDALWADAAISAVGVDWYPPLSDWRDGEHADRTLSDSIYELDYLQSRIEGGEGYDWYYRSPQDRLAQVRTAITDGAYNKAWVFRPKDLRNWWSNPHINRIGGVEEAVPTAWAAQSKPIWLVELGCPAIDRGANQPNVFVDPKSSESGWPYASNGGRDDLIQRRVLQSYLDYWDPANGRNPVSSIYGGAMISTGDTCLWAYDARPFPYFPARRDVWGDGANWQVGHRLNGRVGVGDLATALAELLMRAGAPSAAIDVAEVRGALTGVIIDAPSSMRAALEPLLFAHGLEIVETGAKLKVRPRAAAPHVTISGDLLSNRTFTRRAADDGLDIIKIRYIDSQRDYRLGMASARLSSSAASAEIIDLPMVMDDAQATALAWRAVREAGLVREQFVADLSTQLLALEAGDHITVAGETRRFQLVERTWRSGRFIEAAPDVDGDMPAAGVETGVAAALAPDPTPVVVAFSLPPMPDDEADDRCVAAVFAEPWRGPHAVHLGPDRASAREVGLAFAPAIIGELHAPLWPGPVGRWDRGNEAIVRLYGGRLESVSEQAVLEGANAFAVIDPGGGLEIVQAAQCALIGEGLWRLSGLLRGLQGTRRPAVAPIASRVVKLDSALLRFSVAPELRAAPASVIAPRLGWPVTDELAAEATTALGDLWARPFAPAHLTARRQANGDIEIRWIRCARIGGDAWRAADPPLGEEVERYRIDILSNGQVKRRYETAEPVCTYPGGDSLADFGAPPASLTVQAAQWSQRYGYGQVRESVLWL